MDRCEKVDLTREFNDDGTVTIKLALTFPTDAFITHVMPESCMACPIGYFFNNDKKDSKKERVPCGRMQPVDSKRRSPFCKLITLEQFIRQQMDNKEA